jgi:hypothetical protein
MGAWACANDTTMALTKAESNLAFFMAAESFSLRTEVLPL